MWRLYSRSWVNFLPHWSHSLSRFCFTRPFFPCVAFLTCLLNRAFSKNSFPHTLHLRTQTRVFNMQRCSGHRVHTDRAWTPSPLGLTCRARPRCGTWRGSTSPSSSCSTSHTPGTGRASGPGAYSCAAEDLLLHRTSYHSCRTGLKWNQWNVVTPYGLWMWRWTATHCVQAIGRTSGLGWCFFMCLLRAEARKKVAPHVLHKYFDSPADNISWWTVKTASS